MWTCKTGKNQDVEIGTTVHDVLNTANDEQIKYEVLKKMPFADFLKYLVDYAFLYITFNKFTNKFSNLIL